MRAFPPLHTVDEAIYITSMERRKHGTEGRLLSGADKRSEPDSDELTSEKNPHGQTVTQQVNLFCFGKTSKKKKDLVSDISRKLSSVSSYDTIDSENSDDSESTISSEQYLPAKGIKESSKDQPKSKSSSSTSETLDAGRVPRETEGWSVSTDEDHIAESLKNNQNQPKKVEPDNKKLSLKPEPESRNFDDLTTPIKGFPGIHSQKRRSSEEPDTGRQKNPEKKNKPWVSQTSRKPLDGKRKPVQILSVKPPRSATKVTTKRLYHIQIPEEDRPRPWFNAQFSFSDNNNINWKYEGPIKMKNYYSTSSYK